MSRASEVAFRLRRWLSQPQKVFVTCVFVFIISLFLNGTLWKVWGLYRDESVIKDQIADTEKLSVKISSQTLQAKDPTFIERQARDKMDLVSENDLIFVFPE